MTEGIAAAEYTGTSGDLAWRLAPVGVGLVSLALGVVAIGHRSLTTDEASALAASRRPIGSLLSHIVHDDPAQAGGLLLLKLAGTLGDTETALRCRSRLPSRSPRRCSQSSERCCSVGSAGSSPVSRSRSTPASSRQLGRRVRTRSGCSGWCSSTLLFVVALERGGGWRWIPYAVVAAALPLTHPLAASVLAAHGAALIALRERPDLRRAGIALLAGTVVAGVLLAWMAADRSTRPTEPERSISPVSATGSSHPIGRNPDPRDRARSPASTRFSRFAGARSGRWRGVLVAALIAAPFVAAPAGCAGLPVFTDALVLCAPGLALAAGASVPLLSPVRGLVWAGVALLLVSSAVTLEIRLTATPRQDWRALPRR